MGIKGLVLGAFGALCLAAGAQAGTVTFNFAVGVSPGPNAGGWYNSLSYSEGGIGLTVTGGPVANQKAAWVKTWSGAGLGVCSGFEQPNCVTGDHQVDSFGTDEFVILAFDTAVNLSKITFNYLNNDDTFDLSVNGGQVIDNGALPNGVSWGSANFDPAKMGSMFAIGAGVTQTRVCERSRSSGDNECWTKTMNSAFKIKSVTVSAVPVPAAGLLLVGGLGLLGAMRRRKSAA